MVINEPMLVNAESTDHKRRRKTSQIIFPKSVRKLKANPEYNDMARTKSKAPVGNLISKHVAGSLAVATPGQAESEFC